ncbi:cytochrome P450 [Elysia marginata]|uniref:Cytochrome P450 n=1 Tax=Elysia marginata TaxID=1093978 RepID=A0AAV4J9B6_9GAST|nr:cytochrome P450 [Elysia marginata]
MPAPGTAPDDDDDDCNENLPFEAKPTSLVFSSKAACKSSSSLQQVTPSIVPSLEMVVALLVTITLVAATSILLNVRPYLIPPGPRRLPLIGNLYIFFRNPGFIELAAGLRERYGDVYSLYLGNKLMVVINSLDLIKEAFVTQGDALLDRPQGLAYEIFTKDKGVINTNGKQWRDHRRFIMHTFLDFGVGQDALENTVSPEIARLVQCIRDKGADASFDPCDALRFTSARLIFKVILNKRFEGEEKADLEMFIAATDSVLQNFGVLSALHFLPFVRMLPGNIFNMDKIRTTDTQIRKFMHCQVERRAIHLAATGDIQCLADSYLQKIQTNRSLGIETHTFDADNLVQVMLELVVAGTDTTATTLQWFLLYMVLNPEEQTMLHEEIDVELDGTFPTLKDRGRLPYLDAAILETQRLADAVPFAVTRSPSEDITLGGFRIPKGCIVVPSLTSVLMDSELFPQPEAFKPSRFLRRKNAKLRDLGLIPFNIGKRNCLGESLARVELFLVSAALIQSFRFQLPEGESLPSLKGIVGATRKPCPFRIQAIPRT